MKRPSDGVHINRLILANSLGLWHSVVLYVTRELKNHIFYWWFFSKGSFHIMFTLIAFMLSHASIEFQVPSLSRLSKRLSISHYVPFNYGQLNCPTHNHHLISYKPNGSPCLSRKNTSFWQPPQVIKTLQIYNLLLAIKCHNFNFFLVTRSSLERICIGCHGSLFWITECGFANILSQNKEHVAKFTPMKDA
jgi:hypothetical protein